MLGKRESGKTDGAGDLLKDLRFGWKGIHDAADAFRGTVNGSIDHVCHDRKGEEREYAVADKGFRGLKKTDEHFGWNSGVPADGSGVRIERLREANHRNNTSTPGPYSTTASSSTTPVSSSPTVSPTSSPTSSLASPPPTSALSPSDPPPPYTPLPHSQVPPPLPPR